MEAYAEEQWADLLSARFDREDEGKATGVTFEGTGLSSNVERDGCYGEWAKGKQLLLLNTLNSEKNTTGERIGQDTVSLVTTTIEKQRLMLNTTSARAKLTRAKLLDFGLAQINIAKRNTLGSSLLLASGQV